jgi:hypothetical protein
MKSVQRIYLQFSDYAVSTLNVYVHMIDDNGIFTWKLCVRKLPVVELRHYHMILL